MGARAGGRSQTIQIAKDGVRQIGGKFRGEVNLSLPIPKTLIVPIGHQNMTGPTVGGDHDWFTQGLVGDVLPMPKRLL